MIKELDLVTLESDVLSGRTIFIEFLDYSILNFMLLLSSFLKMKVLYISRSFLPIHVKTILDFTRSLFLSFSAAVMYKVSLCFYFRYCSAIFFSKGIGSGGVNRSITFGGFRVFDRDIKFLS